MTTATTIRLADGKPLVTDGPFADTKEVFGGYYLYEADNLDQAIEMAARIPALRLGGTIEVRPVMGKGLTEPTARAGLPRRVGTRPRLPLSYLGDFDLAEEAVAEAFAIAARRWPSDGVPASPARGW